MTFDPRRPRRPASGMLPGDDERCEKLAAFDGTRCVHMRKHKGTCEARDEDRCPKGVKKFVTRESMWRSGSYGHLVSVEETSRCVFAVGHPGECE